MTVLTKEHLLYLRDESGAPRLLRFETKIYPLIVDEELSLLKAELSKARDEETRGVLKEGIAELEKVVADAPVFKGCFRPLLIREHAEYLEKGVDKLAVLKNHLFTEDGKPFFGDGEEALVKDRDFVERVYHSLMEESGVLTSVKKKANRIYQSCLLEIEKRRLLNARRSAKSTRESRDE